LSTDALFQVIIFCLRGFKTKNGFPFMGSYVFNVVPHVDVISDFFGHLLDGGGAT